MFATKTSIRKYQTSASRWIVIDCSLSYLSGNFAPIRKTLPLTPCSYTGEIPEILVGGQYVRNGGNPITNDDLGRDAHWFDGDGMLSGVLFDRTSNGEIAPSFVNQFILTDVLISAASNPSLKTPLLPSISTLVNPAARLLLIICRILRTVLLVLLSHLPGSKHAVKRISAANTGIFFHDGRALATCESGPPMRIQLPGLETVGWYDGQSAEGESQENTIGEVIGGKGIHSFMKEWTTGHPKVDPNTDDMILFHCTFVSPYVHYSVIPSTENARKKPGPGLYTSKLLNAPVPGVSGGKMMHDFGVSARYTVIMDLPLSLDPFNLARNRPVVAYDRTKPSRFGVFPRCDPSKVVWFETAACIIFHTANTWDCWSDNGSVMINMLACRLNSASVVFAAGNLPRPQMPHLSSEDEREAPMSFFASYEEDMDEKNGAKINESELESSPLLKRTNSMSVPEKISRETNQTYEEEQCRLYYYQFSLPDNSSRKAEITAQYALSALPFEFPTVNPYFEMASARYIYGCSTSSSGFDTALGKATKIDVLVKMDVQTLLARASKRPPRSVTGCVDDRDMESVLADQKSGVSGPIKCFKMPAGWYAQEARFVTRDASACRRYPSREDDGYLLFYAFDESQLDQNGQCSDEAISELWILNARNMADVVARVRLPQRVPYGLHGNWFSEDMIKNQRKVEKMRSIPAVDESSWSQWWMQKLIAMLG
jgi:carotenoid cleavage dioxygenase-like enzyme